MISDFWKEKYRRESSKSWNLFYKRNTTKFYRDRHWTDREFPELSKDENQVPRQKNNDLGFIRDWLWCWKLHAPASSKVSQTIYLWM